MSYRMLIFDFRDSEKRFFEENSFENFDIIFFKESLNEAMLSQLTDKDFEETVAISVFVDSIIDEFIISRFKNLRVVSTRSTGYDHICLRTCAEKHIALINVDFQSNTTVAQYTMTLILVLVRKLNYIHFNKYSADVFCGRDLSTMTIGVIGTGAVGATVCRYAWTFGMKILAYDVFENEDLVQSYGVEYVDLKTLLKSVDILTIHMPYDEKSYHLFGKNYFAMMKDNSYLINVSRGELINNEDLLYFVRQGKFAGVGLDVVSCDDGHGREKSSINCFEYSEIIQELKKCPNVIITPHIAYNTQETVDYILKMTFIGISDSIQGGHKYRVV